MKVNAIDVSPNAYELINSFNNWLEESSKTSYRFTTEEQIALQRMVKIMDNQINLLIEYELKNKEGK